MIMRDAVVEGFGNLDQLGFFYVHLNLSKRAASGALQAMHETEYISINLKKKKHENQLLHKLTYTYFEDLKTGNQ